MEIDEDAPLALSFRDFKRNRSSSRNKNQPQAPPEEPAPLSPDLHPSQLPPADEQSTAKAPPKILVAEFDYSVENHFKAIDKIAKLCGYAETLDCNEAEIKRLSDSIIFLRHWRDFNYKPRIVRFACQRNSEEKEVMGEVTLPQFSAAAVPENEIRNASEVGVEHIKDFVMHVGGSVWALNWCPRVDRNPDNCIKSEFVAVAAHPPDSSYHEIGASLTGRGVVQIWCFLTIYGKDVPSQGKKKSRPDSKKKDLTVVPRPRGRPRKKPLVDPVEKIDTDNQYAQPFAIEYPMGSHELKSSEGTSQNASKPEDCVRIDRDSDIGGHPNTLVLTGSNGRRNKQKAGEENQIHNNSLHIVRHCQQGQPPLMDPLTLASCSLNSMNLDNKDILSISSSANSIPIDVALPRMMLCLAHNGKVAWDVKWRPVSACFPESRNTLGYLAVLLGSGALEVLDSSLMFCFPIVSMLHPRFDNLCLLIPDIASSVSLIEWLSAVEISASVYSDTKYGIQSLHLKQ